MNPLLAPYRDGGRLPFPVYDCHAHADLHYHFPIQQGDLEHYVRELDLAGIDGTIVTSLNGQSPEMVEGNRTVRGMIRRHPDRFLGYLTVNPHYPDRVRQTIAEFADEPGFVGVKVHDGICRCPVDDPKWDPVYELAHERRWLLLSHTWGAESIRKHAAIARRFPNLQLIFGHAGADEGGYLAAIEAAKDVPNVYLDLTLSMTRLGVVEWLVGAVGPERVLFGTDMPFFDGRGAPAWVAFADLPVNHMALILGGNILRLLGNNASRWRRDVNNRPA